MPRPISRSTAATSRISRSSTPSSGTWPAGRAGIVSAMHKVEAFAANAAVSVDLGSRSYEIAIGEGLLKEAGKRLRPLLKRPFTAIVTDATVAKLHLEALRASLASAGIDSTS